MILCGRHAFRFVGVLLCTALWLGPAAAQSTMVRMHTTLGPVDIRLLDAEAPATVANFLGYVRSGAYNSTFLHRSVPGFIVQGGGFSWPLGASTHTNVPAGPPVINEYSASRSNVRATVAMAKLGSSPNSATNQWFFNLANNASNLDNQNGGFTVFGRVTTPGMAVVDSIAALQVANAGGVSAAFTELPILRFPSDNRLSRSIVVLVDRAEELPTAASDADRAFNYLEATYWRFLKPPGSVSGTAAAGGVTYYYRFYPASNSYIGLSVPGNEVFYLVPEVGPNITRFSTLADLMPTVAAAGY